MQSNDILFDVSDRTQFEVTGSDRTRFLNGLTSNDIKRLKTGEGCETFLTSLKGKVIAHVYAFCYQNSIWLDGTSGQQTAIANQLSRYVLIDDVQISDRSTERAELYLTGPHAAQLLQIDQTLPICGHVNRELDGDSFDIRRVDMFGNPGFLMSVSVARKESVKQGLRGVGVIEGSPEQFESLRVKAGYPRFGIDITDDNLAQEVARTKQCISFDKGCYLGQETIARLDSMGHTNRELRRLQLNTDVAPAESTPIFDEDGTMELGHITSATIDCVDPTENSGCQVFAIGILKRAALKPDFKVLLKNGDSTVTGRVLS